MWGDLMVSTIKKLCAERGMSLKDLEQETGIGTNSIYKWDKISPAVKSVAVVAQYFGVSVDFIIGIGESAIPDDERRLRANFRLLNESQKQAVFALMSGFLSDPIRKETKIS